ncbi:hypothetical protein [Mesorhizobium sp. WSM3882]|uniref:hypothetical protein n=1 Tax=Mesorhizobium sp. WSM3882 TaxID=2029407 RepID=UPI0032AFBD92
MRLPRRRAARQRTGRNWNVVVRRIDDPGAGREDIAGTFAIRLELDLGSPGKRRLATQVLARETVAPAVGAADEAEALALVIVKNFAAHQIPPSVEFFPFARFDMSAGRRARAMAFSRLS